MLLTNTPPSTAPAGDATPFVGRVGSLDQPLPEFELVDLDGQPVDLAAYAGRPVFVNFWGTWCPPCVREPPEMQAFAAAGAGRRGGDRIQQHRIARCDSRLLRRQRPRPAGHRLCAGQRQRDVPLVRDLSNAHDLSGRCRTDRAVGQVWAVRPSRMTAYLNELAN
ncbi:MAG: TlpA family protein disulfide reductase [Chloroflexi bacterium]|nr:TlpA family protein disulfide reductase [Chloroflexota bacterium]